MIFYEFVRVATQMELSLDEIFIGKTIFRWVHVEYENGRNVTDSSGDAEFEIDGDSATFTIIVDGDRQSREYVTYDGETINITLGQDDEEDNEEES